MFGLSSVPDVKVLKLQPIHASLVLATDGLWDVCSAQQAAHIVNLSVNDGWEVFALLTLLN
jgi:serine/threonine protein phosphatase PrpC